MKDGLTSREAKDVRGTEGSSEATEDLDREAHRSYPCYCCGKREIVSAELCAECAEGNEPFFTSKYAVPRGPR